MINGSCESRVEFIVEEANMEKITSKDYLYFNLIYVMCAFCLPPKQISLVI